jgi:hypothetical protein
VAPALEIKGLDKLLARFKQAPKLIEAELEDAGDSVLAVGIQKLAAYPPAPSGSRYRRTGALGRGWRTTDRRFVVAGAARSVVLRNPVSYMPVVQGKGQQAKVHKGRWATVEDVQAELEPLAMQKLQRAGENVARALAGG